MHAKWFPLCGPIAQSIPALPSSKFLMLLGRVSTHIHREFLFFFISLFLYLPYQPCLLFCSWTLSMGSKMKIYVKNWADESIAKGPWPPGAKDCALVCVRWCCRPGLARQIWSVLALWKIGVIKTQFKAHRLEYIMHRDKRSLYNRA